jgi:phage-related protein
MLGVVLFFKTETAKIVTMLCTVFLYDSGFSFWIIHAWKKTVGGKTQKTPQNSENTITGRY